MLAERRSGDRGAALRRCVRQEHVVDDVRIERARDERGRAREESVDDDRPSCSRRLEVEAGHCRELEPADRGEDAERSAHMRVQRERVGDDTSLPRDDAIRNARAGADDLARLGARERADERGRRRRVADADLARCEELVSRGDRAARGLFAHEHGGRGLVECHRGRAPKVRRARAHLRACERDARRDRRHRKIA